MLYNSITSAAGVVEWEKLLKFSEQNLKKIFVVSTTEGQALLIFTANTISHGWHMALHEGNRKRSLSKTMRRTGHIYQAVIVSANFCVSWWAQTGQGITVLNLEGESS